MMFLVGAVGAGISVYLAMKLMEASRIVDDKGLALASLGLLIFAWALFLEGLDFVLGELHPMPRGMGARMGWYMHPAMAFIRMRDLSILASSFYLVSYVLYFAGIFVSSSTLLSLPIILLLYLDFNAIALISLITGALYSYFKLGIGGKKWSAYLTVLAMSHVLSTLGVMSLNSTIFSLGYVLRSIAPLILLCAARCEA